MAISDTSKWQFLTTVTPKEVNSSNLLVNVMYISKYESVYVTYTFIPNSRVFNHSHSNVYVTYIFFT